MVYMYGRGQALKIHARIYSTNVSYVRNSLFHYTIILNIPNVPQKTTKILVNVSFIYLRNYMILSGKNFVPGKRKTVEGYRDVCIILSL